MRLRMSSMLIIASRSPYEASDQTAAEPMEGLPAPDRAQLRIVLRRNSLVPWSVQLERASTAAFGMSVPEPPHPRPSPVSPLLASSTNAWRRFGPPLF